MKNIIDIIEGLKIGSNTKVKDIKHDKEISDINEIYKILCLNDKNILKYPKDRIDFIKENIRDWKAKNNIKKFKICMSNSSLFPYESYITDKKIKLNLVVPKEKYIIDILKKLEFGSFIYRNDYCEIKSLNKYKIFSISIKPEYRFISFYILDANEWENLN